MAIYGDLSTMGLADLLQWAALNEKTGVLEIERYKISRRIEFRKGWIGACSSDDPPSRLGQFLLSRGKITEESLRQALARQEVSHENLGVILVDMGVLSRADLTRQVTAKAQETIHSLFDWEDAVFRFHDGSTLDPNQMEVDLSVNEILMKGIQRQDELKRIREVFVSSGVVLRRSGKEAPGRLMERAVANRIYESIDGKRTLAELLLHAHASEFLVLKLLFRLHQLGLIEVSETRPPSPKSRTLLDPRPMRRRRRRPQSSEAKFNRDADAAPDDSSEIAADLEEALDAKEALDTEVEAAQQLIGRAEYGAALELLNASYRAHPAEDYLRRLIVKTESAYVDLTRSLDLSPERVPFVVQHPTQEQLDAFEPAARYLLGKVDGRADIKALLWSAPLREVDALRSLRALIDDGILEVGSPVSAPKPAEAASQLEI